VREFLRSSRAHLAAVVLALVGLLAVLVYNAWLCDDAYITFRTVDNLVSGHGLLWNAAERVQGFTHPLWMFLVAACYALFGDVYYTVIVLQLLIAVVCAALLVSLVARDRLRAVIALVALGLSKAFVDFSTSGLENGLSHLILIGFVVVLFRARGSFRSSAVLALLFSLALLSRMDNVLLLLPALGLALYRNVRASGLRASIRGGMPWLLLGFAPFCVWEIFSLVYYGFAMPNTAYAKLATGIPQAEYAAQGLWYLVNSLGLDPLTLLVIGCGAGAALIAGNAESRALALGIVLHLIYVVRIGGDFMSGRFLSLPLLAAVILIARIDVRKGWLLNLSFGALVLIAAAAGSFPTLGLRYHERHGAPQDSHGIADHRLQLLHAAGLVNATIGEQMPRHDWAKRGLRLRARRDKRVFRLGGTGFTGFFAGPGVHIVDMWALTDPLLARLPFEELKKGRGWRIGHFHRRVPEGYMETLSSGRNVIADPDLAEYYDKLRLITRGDLFSAERFAAIWEINTGGYDHLIERYVERHPVSR
jgi:arabinofuranosyltransferase